MVFLNRRRFLSQAARGAGVLAATAAASGGASESAQASTVPFAGTEAPWVPATGAHGLLCISMDDCDADMYVVAARLSALNQRGTFCITSDYIGQSGKLTLAQVSEIASWGHEIAAHSLDHPNLTSLTPSEIEAQLDEPRLVLESIVGQGKVSTFAYPFGTGHTPSGRNAQIDAQIYGRYALVLDTTLYNEVAILNRNDPHAPFLIPRVTWDGTNQEQVLGMVRLAASRAVIACMYFHRLDKNWNPTTVQLIELLELARNLGVPVVTVSEAFGTHRMLVDPGFEAQLASGAVGAWRQFRNNANTVAYVSDKPAVGLHGSQSLELRTLDNGYAYVRQQVHVIPSTTYTFSGRHYCPVLPASSGRSYMRMRALDYEQKQVDAVRSADAQSPTWAKTSVEYTVPSHVKMVDLELCLTGAPGCVRWDHMWFGPKHIGDFG